MKNIIYIGYADDLDKDTEALENLNLKWGYSGSKTVDILLRRNIVGYYAIILRRRRNGRYHATYLCRRTHGSILAYCKENYPDFSIVPLESIRINQSYQIF